MSRPNTRKSANFMISSVLINSIIAENKSKDNEMNFKTVISKLPSLWHAVLAITNELAENSGTVE